MTWLDLPAGTGFGVTNLPYGIFSVGGDAPRTGVAIGDHVLDLAAATGDPVHATGSLNAFMARGPAAWAALRERLTGWFTGTDDAVSAHLVPRESVTLHLPFEVADYVDFYSSQHHASNLGKLFRPGSPPLTPNWKHLPIAYHGRAGTVRVSGTPVVRPSGQRKAPSDEVPTFGPSRRLDIEAEVGFVVGAPATGPVAVGDFAAHVFGVCVVNDWSARDLQAWEYVPLGPFLGKSFATSVSPWVVPLAALEAARVDPPPRDVELLPYLDDSKERWGLDLQLTVSLNGVVVSNPPFRQLYWTAAQQLAHLTVNGATSRIGDLFASGTVSGPEPDERGSLIELAWNGEAPLRLPDGSTRTFLEDGDTVTISATAPALDGTRLSFGDVTGRIEPAR
ncbi:fumarylacetoacetase [Cryptosporangium arvum]|uniref:fumarylacetoacetase n=1 Tax=Cryptosporangium arvum TaxID=80871 RepID=UPI0004B2854B|nr:fumarylacetoacetase [Cryptosporangium arvum]